MTSYFLQNRQIEILEALIREHLKSGEPISSKTLRQKQHMDLSPSTIRHYFFQLTQEGLLEQPHVSAGRIPTNKAWQIFVSKVLNEWEMFDEIETHMLREMERFMKPQKSLSLDRLTDALSDKAKSFSFCYLFSDGDIHKNGYRYLFIDFNKDQLGEINQIAKDLDGIDEKIRNFKLMLDSKPLAYIGKNNPFINSEYLSTLVTGLSGDGILGLIGPKTILSEHNIALIKAAEELIKS